MARSWMTSGLASRGRRLFSAAVAIIIGVAFLTTSLATLFTAQAGLEDAVASGVRDADLVLSPAELSLEISDYDTVTSLEGLDSVVGEAMVFAELGANEYVLGTNLPSTGVTLIEGRLPSAPGEVLATTALAREGSGTGSTLRLAPMQDEDGAPRDPVSLEVVGVGTTGQGEPGSFGPGFLASDATLRLIDPVLTYRSIQVDVSPGTTLEVVRQELTAAVQGAVVQTGPEAAQERVAQLTGETAVLAAMLLGFGAVALATAAIVIANTFTITLAQRTGELALLRCVGATTRQVRRSVLLEAVALGLVASALGVAVGLAAAWGLLEIGRRSDFAIPLGSGLEVGVLTLVLPLVVGTIVTLLASLWPAVRATRVSPLAALRPSGPTGERRQVGILRLAIAFLLVAGGTAMMFFAATHRDVLTGIGGGLVSFAGVLVAAVVVVPLAVRGLGVVARAVGVPGRLAVDNAVRNPGRAAATSAALIVGVTLITMTSVGAASGEKTALGEIDQEYAVDMVATSSPEEASRVEPIDGPVRDAMIPGTLEAGLVDRFAAVKGVAAALPVDTGYLTLGESWAESEAIGLDPATVGQVLRSQVLIDQIKPGVVGLGDMDMAVNGLAAGDVISVSGAAGSKELTVQEIGLGQGRLTLHVDDLKALDGDQVRQGVALIRLADKADAAQTYANVSDIADEAGLQVGGAAAQRAQITQVLDVLVLVTTALLGVAVVIAVVGIANTLSLSIIERHREHALLRGLGLTRTQMRTMLLIEGVLLALVSAGLGLALGVGYAALGIQTVLPVGTALELAIPWGRVGMIVGVAILAGLLASVLPARRATRVSPAEGLAAA